MKRVLISIFWWAVTILTLFILDDLLFGPIFWGLSIISRPLSTAVAFIASWSFGMWLITAGLSAKPSGLAQFFLTRLMLDRKNVEISRREESIKRQAFSGLGAVVVTPLIGAVIPVLLLRKHQLMPAKTLRVYAVCLTALYATEFALLHGGYGIGGVVSHFL